MIPIKHFATLIVCVAAAVAFAAAMVLPSELVGLVAKAQIREPLSSWCRGDFQARTPNTFAVAVPLSSSGGRYLVLGWTETAIELASFSGDADLACYSLAEAKKLNESIIRSKTIHGGISLALNTTVICGFVDNARAVCWQYSPAKSAFVKVGEWIT